MCLQNFALHFHFHFQEFHVFWHFATKAYKLMLRASCLDCSFDLAPALNWAAWIQSPQAITWHRLFPTVSFRSVPYMGS
jgi:hypothetical protein